MWVTLVLAGLGVGLFLWYRKRPDQVRACAQEGGAGLLKAVEYAKGKLKK